MSDKSTTPEHIFQGYVNNIRRYFDESLGGPVGAWLGFPTTREALSETLASIGAGPDDVFVEHYESPLAGLSNNMPRTMNLDELNYLAEKLSALAENGLEMFSAIMEQGRNQHCGSLRKIINVSENLDCFDYYSGISTVEVYGDVTANMDRDEHWKVLARLESSEVLADRDFAAYVKRLEKCVDAEAYGCAVIMQEQGSITQNGYLRLSVNEIPEKYTGPQDIPAGYRLTEAPEADGRKPSLLGAVAALKEHQAQRDAEDHPSTSLEAPSGPEL